MTDGRPQGHPTRGRARARRAAGPAVVASRRWNAHGRVLPDFVVLGAQKSGTTTLYTQLATHPAVIPALRKEVHYFDAPPRPIEWYRAVLPAASRGDRDARRASGTALTGEATPFYLLPSRRAGAAARGGAATRGCRDPARPGGPRDVRLPPRGAHGPRAPSDRGRARPRRDEDALAGVAIEWYDDPACPARLRGYLAARSLRRSSSSGGSRSLPREQVLVLETPRARRRRRTRQDARLPRAPAHGGIAAAADRNVGAYEPPGDRDRDDHSASTSRPHNERLFDAPRPPLRLAA